MFVLDYREIGEETAWRIMPHKKDYLKRYGKSYVCVTTAIRPSKHTSVVLVLTFKLSPKYINVNDDMDISVLCHQDNQNLHACE